MKFYGLIGEKLGHSLSPAIHKKIGKIRNININYQLFEIEQKNIESALYGLAALGAGGINVTIPYKVDVLSYSDSVSPEAARIGSANTLSFHGKKISAYNTDYYGFTKSLERYNAPVVGARVLVLGDGGAARSVCLALIDSGAREVVVASRKKGEKWFLVGEHRFEIISYDSLEIKGSWDILVNTTPVGMFSGDNDCPVDHEIIENCSFVFDLIYNSLRTNLLKIADSLNIRNCNGLYMLISQAAEAQRIWNKIELTECEIDEIYKEICTEICTEII